MAEQKERKILLVEDDVIAQMTLVKMLNEMGYKSIATANSYESAMMLFEEAKFDIALLDIFLKGKKTGLDFAKDIHIPVLFITASTDKTTYDEMLSVKNIGILRKPYNFKQIDTVLNQFFTKSDHLLVPGSEENQLVDSVFEAANVGICVTNKDRKFVKVNRAYCQIYGYSESELVGKDFTMVLPKNAIEYASKLHDDYIAEKTEESAGEWTVKNKAGISIDIWVTAGRFKTLDGQVFKVTTVTDISDQKEYVRNLEKLLSEKEMLMRELHHRVKNNLNRISGLFYLHESSNPEVTHALMDARNRISALSLVHERLYAEENLTSIDIKEYFQGLIDGVRSAFTKNSGIKISSNIQPVEVDGDDAITLGLILNEGLSNCFKHAFNGEPDSTKKILIGFKMEQDFYVMEISDNGKGLDKSKEKKKSLGLSLIKNMVSSGSMELKNLDPGLQLRVKLKKEKKDQDLTPFSPNHPMT